MGGRRAGRTDALAAGSAAKAYCTRAARVGLRDRHPGAWRHRQYLGVPGPRLPASSAAFERCPGRGRRESGTGARGAGDRGRRWTSLTRTRKREFRLRLREWLGHNNPGLPPSSTSDEYWDGQADWHQALYDAGFFGLSWPKEVGGHDLASVYDVILDEELIAAGAPPRPSVGYLVQGLLEHGNEDVQRRFLP